MFTFDEVTDDVEALARRVRSVLARRHAIHIGELCLRLGVDRTTVQAELEGMIARGEVERLRPVDCAGEDQDFFRVNRPAAMWVRFDDGALTRAAQDGREHVRLAGEAMACLAG